MKTYLVEYKLNLPGNITKSGVETVRAVGEDGAHKAADDWLRSINPKAEVHLGDVVEV